jgi:hypothetical protein
VSPPSVDMLPFGVTIPATVPQRSEIPEGLMNYPVFNLVGNNSETLKRTDKYDKNYKYFKLNL